MKLLVIDGNSIINRAFYGIKLLTTKDGRYTNAIYGFLTMFLKLKEDYAPDAVAIAFDVKAPTFRHELYSGYKAQRKGMPEELAQQLPVLKELLHALGLKTVELAGWEADDILGTFADKCTQDDRCFIATGDRDSLQLIDENVSVVLASTKMGRPLSIFYDKEKIVEEYGVDPHTLIEIKALMGDSSDNIPGVAGVGEKTAKVLIQRFGSIDKLYEELDDSDLRQTLKDRLMTGKEMAFLSRTLSTISAAVPVDTAYESYVPKAPDVLQVTKIMADLEMFKLLERLDLKAVRTDVSTHEDSPGQPPEKPWQFVEEEDPLAVLEKLKKAKQAYFTSQYTAGEITDMFFAGTDKVTHIAGLNFGFAPFIKAFLENADIKKYTSDIKQLAGYSEHCAFKLAGAAGDIMLAGYVLNPNAGDYDISRLAQEYAVKQPLLTSENPNALDTAVLPALFEELNEKIQADGQMNLLNTIELPLSQVLAAMEYRGFAVDKKGLAAFGKMIEEKIIGIETNVYEAVGYEFNLNSPKQLSEALFTKLGLTKKKKTKSGYSTNAEVLESLINEHPVIEQILEYRTLAKLKQTYCDGLVKVIGDDGRIHSTFKQTETRTGRLSSTEPNLQNIPIRSELGRELRRFFHAKDGYLLVDADYSQIELRLLAHISNDEVMIKAFNDNQDIHAITASQVFNMPLEMVTPHMRDSAKAVNFGIVYGIGAFSLAKDIGVTRAEAARYIEDYLEHFSGVRDYMKDIVEQAKEQGYVETLFNRRRYLPELVSTNANLRAFGERVALNMPIQGTAADIIKIAMVKVHERLIKEKLKARLIMQVHDELIAEAPEAEAETVAKILAEEMENAVEMRVRLIADVNIGKTWYDAKG
ncbi:MAG TPA: DNA polymerase I [Clostridia bacterium]|nr:DNA polymerase I [Clostridia bacterium]